MGYFDRKRRRGAAREQIREAHQRSVDEGWWERWTEAVPPAPADGRWFLRFSVPERDGDSGRRRGVFSVAYELLDGGELGESPRRRLQEVVSWFEKYLPPKDPGEDAAVFFFKSDAGTCARRIWELVALLRECGCPPDMVKVRNPGKVVYEDDHQVAAIPFRSSGVE